MRHQHSAMLVLLSALTYGATAAGAVLTLVTGNAGALDHYPGADGLIGTGDDIVSPARTTLNASGANVLASYSYNAFDFVGDGSSTDPALPPGMNAVTFLEGAVSVDTTVAVFGGGPLITGLEVSGTEPFFGHGAYSATLLGVNGGDYDAASGAISINFNFETNLLSGTAQAVDFELDGHAWLIAAADFAQPTGVAYLDEVLLPLAMDIGAGRLFWADVSGVVPASSNGTGFAAFPSMPVRAVIVAVTPVPLPAAGWLLAAALGAFALKGRRKGVQP